MITGICLLLYPAVSDIWNRLHASGMIQSYEEIMEQQDEKDMIRMKEEADAYNEMLRQKDNRFVMDEAEKLAYEKLLDVTGTGIMAYLEIPVIHLRLPVYHGIDEEVLQKAAGHLPGSSLPTGGKGTHCVLSGHRGLPSARLFTDIVRLKKGDRFYISVLKECHEYQVERIITVAPDRMDALGIEEEKDYVTLVTCTPYGINSHRLLIRGTRIN